MISTNKSSAGNTSEESVVVTCLASSRNFKYFWLCFVAVEKMLFGQLLSAGCKYPKFRPKRTVMYAYSKFV